MGPQSGQFVEFVARRKGVTRIDYPDDSPQRGQIVVESAKERKHYFPDRKEIFIAPGREEFGFLQMPGFEAAQEREVDGGDVAGRATRLLEMVAGGQVVQRLWIDSEKFVVLKREMFSPRGDKVGSYAFTTIDFNANLRSVDFSLRIPGDKVVTPYTMRERLATKGGFANIGFGPRDGPRLEFVRVQRIRDEDVLVQSYTDGKNRFSLFQLSGSIDPQRLTRFSGPRAKILRWQRDGRTFVLLGDLSKERLDALARKLGA